MHRRTGIRRAALQQLGTIDFATGVIAGNYGDATHVGAFTVDSVGRLLSAHNVPISIPAGAILPGSVIFTAVLPQASPGAGKAVLYSDSTNGGVMTAKGPTGLVSVMARVVAPPTNKFMIGIAADGQPQVQTVQLAALEAIGIQSVVMNPTNAIAAPVQVGMPTLRTSLAGIGGDLGRADLWRKAQGLIAETAPHNVCGFVSPPGPTTNICYAMQVFLVAGEVITKAAVCTSTQSPGTLTSSFVALYDPNRDLQASTGNLGNLWSTAAGNIQVSNFAAPFTVVTTGIHFVTVLIVNTGQPPNLLLWMPPGASATLSGGIGGSISGGLYYFTHNVAVSTPPVALTPATALAAPIGFWVGLA